MSPDVELNADLPPNLVSSRLNRPEPELRKPKKPKYLLKMDNFKAVVQRLSLDHPQFDPDTFMDTFEVLKWWLVDAEKTPYTRNVQDAIAELTIVGSIIEFRIGSYTIQPVFDRKR